jgi:hypothetical protein
MNGGVMAVARTAHPLSEPQQPPQRARSIQAVIDTTLLELVRTVGEITDDETEIVATVIHMLRSGTVRLTGAFRGEPLNKLLD